MTKLSRGKGLRSNAIKVLAATTALSAFASQAHAIQLDFGEVTGAFDSTVSAGVSMSMSDPDKRFIGGGNGGLQPSNSFVILGANGVGDFVTLNSDAAGLTNGQDTASYSGSMNGDDGRLNYDKHDIFSANVKITSDLVLNWENYTFFTRGTAFYDAVGDDAGHTNRSDLDDNVRSEVGKEAEILDLFISGDFDLGELPLNLRLGKQVVSWGESTFNINGINVINPIDVTKFRKPGAEVKEGLTPVWLAYAQLGLPFDLSLEGFYQIKYDNFTLDPQGTFFSGNDVVGFTNSSVGGNFGGVPMLGGSATSGDYYRNCNAASGGSLLYLKSDTACSNGTASFAHYTRPYALNSTGTAFIRDPNETATNNEAARFAANDNHILARFDEVQADDSGQFGLALRWYAEALNSTEFGFYFMNYHSRLPLVNFAYNKDTMAFGTDYRVTTGFGLESAGTAGVANLFGCAPLASAFSTAAGLALGGNTDGAKAVVQQALATNAATQQLSADQLAALQGTGTTGDPADLAPLYATSTGAFNILGNPTGLTTGQAYALLGGDTTADGKVDFYSSTLVRCLQTLSNTTASAASPIGQFTTSGTEAMAFDYTSGLGIQVEYPEDIKLYGISFNTLLGDWSVQGELAYRQDQPLQLETNELFGVSLVESCLLNGLGSVIYDSLQASQRYLRDGRCDPNTTGLQVVEGYKRKDVLTGTLGFTNLLPQSSMVSQFFGANSTLLLGEATFTKVRDLEGPEELFYAGPGAYCSQSAFGPLLGLDPCPNGATDVYPDSFSWGYTVIGRLNYSDVFAGINLTPTVVFKHDVHGDTPGPISNHLEGRKALSLSLSGNYQSTWTGSVSYTNFFGADRRNSSGDRDFASVSVSYSF